MLFLVVHFWLPLLFLVVHTVFVCSPFLVVSTVYGCSYSFWLAVQFLVVCTVSGCSYSFRLFRLFLVFILFLVVHCFWLLFIMLLVGVHTVFVCSDCIWLFRLCLVVQQLLAAVEILFNGPAQNFLKTQQLISNTRLTSSACDGEELEL